MLIVSPQFTAFCGNEIIEVCKALRTGSIEHHEEAYEQITLSSLSFITPCCLRAPSLSVGSALQKSVVRFRHTPWGCHSRRQYLLKTSKATLGRFNHSFYKAHPLTKHGWTCTENLFFDTASCPCSKATRGH